MCDCKSSIYLRPGMDSLIFLVFDFLFSALLLKCCRCRNHGPAWRHFCRSPGLTQVTLCVVRGGDFVPEKVSRPQLSSATTLLSCLCSIVVLLRCRRSFRKLCILQQLSSIRGQASSLQWPVVLSGESHLRSWDSLCTDASQLFYLAAAFFFTSKVLEQQLSVHLW